METEMGSWWEARVAGAVVSNGKMNDKVAYDKETHSDIENNDMKLYKKDTICELYLTEKLLSSIVFRDYTYLPYMILFKFPVGH